jgi:hypothetical protein
MQVLHCGLSREAAEKAERRSKKYMPKNLDYCSIFINHRNNLIFEGIPVYFPSPYDEELSTRADPACDFGRGAYVSRGRGGGGGCSSRYSQWGPVLPADAATSRKAETQSGP